MTGSIVQAISATAELFVGFGLVMLTLAALWGLTALLGRAVVRFERRPSATAAQPPQAAIPVPEDDPDETVVVIAAAAAMIGDVPHRVVAVRPRNSVWGLLGRQDLHASHNVH